MAIVCKFDITITFFFKDESISICQDDWYTMVCAPIKKDDQSLLIETSSVYPQFFLELITTQLRFYMVSPQLSLLIILTMQSYKF